MDTLLGMLKSKTVWLQILGFIAMLLAMFQIDFPTEDQAVIATTIMGVINVVGIVVRIFTNTSLAEKVKQ